MRSWDGDHTKNILQGFLESYYQLLFNFPRICTLLIQTSLLACFGVLHRCGWSVLIVSVEFVDTLLLTAHLELIVARMYLFSLHLQLLLLRWPLNFCGIITTTPYTHSTPDLTLLPAWQTQKQMANDVSSVYQNYLLKFVDKGIYLHQSKKSRQKRWIMVIIKLLC